MAGPVRGVRAGVEGAEGFFSRLEGLGKGTGGIEEVECAVFTAGFGATVVGGAGRSTGPAALTGVARSAHTYAATRAPIRRRRLPTQQ